jgi:predicted nucleic acid-binding protein
VIVVDSSAWIEFFRRTGSRVHRSLARLVRERAELAVTEVVVLEALSGATSARQFATLRAALVGFPVLPLRGPAAYDRAAHLYRACRPRRRGGTEVTDCLFAVAAIEANATILQADRDFEKLARHTFLRTEPLR